jgi:hypothetical protein
MATSHPFETANLKMTCGDVCDVVERRLAQIRQSGVSAAAAAVAQLVEDCDGVSSRNGCAILATLAKRANSLATG